MPNISRIILIVSGLFNAAVGLFIAFSPQPAPHFLLSAHPRLSTISYVFSAHGFLVAQLGFLELFAALWLVHPIAFATAAFPVAIGDIYFSLNVYRIMSDPAFVPHPAEPEFAWASLIWASAEFVAMLTVLLINIGKRERPKFQ